MIKYWIECIKDEPKDPTKIDVRLMLEDSSTGEKRGIQKIIDIPASIDKKNIKPYIDKEMSKIGIDIKDNRDFLDLRTGWSDIKNG